jgi:hypothetical protein
VSEASTSVQHGAPCPSPAAPIKLALCALWLAAAAGCSKDFYCWERGQKDGTRFCYRTRSECEGPAGPTWTACFHRHSAFCAPADAFGARRCTPTRAECERLGPPDERTVCEWVR